MCCFASGQFQKVESFLAAFLPPALLKPPCMLPQEKPTICPLNRLATSCRSHFIFETFFFFYSTPHFKVFATSNPPLPFFFHFSLGQFHILVKFFCSDFPTASQAFPISLTLRKPWALYSSSIPSFKNSLSYLSPIPGNLVPRFLPQLTQTPINEALFCLLQATLPSCN